MECCTLKASRMWPRGDTAPATSAPLGMGAGGACRPFSSPVVSMPRQWAFRGCLSQRKCGRQWAAGIPTTKRARRLGDAMRNAVSSTGLSVVHRQTAHACRLGERCHLRHGPSQHRVPQFLEGGRHLNQHVLERGVCVEKGSDLRLCHLARKFADRTDVLGHLQGPRDSPCSPRPAE